MRFAVSDTGATAIGASAASPGIMLEVTSPDPLVPRGLLPPRMNKASRDLIAGGSPPAGTVVYNTDANQLQAFDGTIWWSLMAAPADGPIIDTLLLLHMDTDFSDSSSGSHSVAVVGDTQVSAAQSKFGGASGLFDGAGDYLRVSAHSDFVFGTGDFTIEAWIRLNDNSGKSDRILANADNGTSGGWQFLVTEVTGRLALWDRVSVVAQGTTNVYDSWHHVAVCRSSGTLRLYVDGNQEASVVNSSNFSLNADLISGGYVGDPGGTGNLSGYIDDLRVSNGAHYTANFTPTGPLD